MLKIKVLKKDTTQIGIIIKMEVMTLIIVKIEFNVKKKMGQRKEIL